MIGNMIRHLTLRHRLIAALVLCAHVCTGTVLISSVGALIAVVEGSHALMVIRSASGYELVLHHAVGKATPEIMDHGTVAARMLVCVCKTSPGGDHKLESTLLTEGDSIKEYLRLGNPALGEPVWMPGVTAADLHGALWTLPIRSGFEASLQRISNQKRWPMVRLALRMQV